MLEPFCVPPSHLKSFAEHFIWECACANICSLSQRELGEWWGKHGSCLTRLKLTPNVEAKAGQAKEQGFFAAINFTTSFLCNNAISGCLFFFKWWNIPG